MRVSESATVAALITFGLSITSPLASSASGFDIRQREPGHISSGRCHMGECAHSKWLHMQTVSSASDSTHIRLTLLGGVSTRTEKAADAEWNTQPHTVDIQCSYSKPMVSGVELDFIENGGLSGAMTNSGLLYMEACHNSLDISPEKARRLGYKEARQPNEKNASSEPLDPSSIIKSLFKQDTVWINKELTSIEGWWSHSSESCKSLGDSDGRVAIGRQTHIHDVEPWTTIFGIGKARFEFYEAKCDIERPQQIGKSAYLFSGKCSGEGEKYRELIAVHINSPNAITITHATPAGKITGTSKLVRCSQRTKI